MGVYIRGMEMPKSCYVCPFCDYVSARCDAVKDNPYTPESRYEKRADFCPLVEVETHGDLIDRDKLEKDIDKYIGGEESRSRFHHWVQVQRTVIPESEEAHT